MIDMVENDIVLRIAFYLKIILLVLHTTFTPNLIRHSIKSKNNNNNNNANRLSAPNSQDMFEYN
jgi:hypothetical protein